MTITISKKDFLSKIAAIAIAIVCFVAYNSLHDSRLVYIMSLVCCGILLLRSIKYKFLFIFYFFVSSYLIFLYPHYLGNLSLGGLQFAGENFYDKCLYIFSVFLSAILFFYKNVPLISINERLDIKDNAFVFYLNIIISIIIIMYGSSGRTIFEASYGYNDGAITTINSYFCVFYLAAYFSSGRIRGRLFLLNAIAIVYCVSVLLIGGRGATISMALVFYLLVLDQRISFVGLLSGILVFFVFLVFWAFVRVGRADAFFSLGLDGIQDIFGLGVSDNRYTMQGGHHTDIFYASTRIISMTDIGVINFGDRIYAFFLFVISVFVPYSVLPPIANLASYMVGDYSSLGGGMVFAYFYTFLSYFGVILIAYIINVVWNKLRTSTNKYTLIYCILVFAMMNGWVAYNPITLFKLCLWGVMYVYFLDVVTANLIKKK